MYASERWSAENHTGRCSDRGTLGMVAPCCEDHPMNGPDMDHGTNDPFSANAGSRQPDLSQYEDPLPDIGSNDAETLRKIKRGTSAFGRIAGITILAGAVGLGYWAYQSSASYDTRMNVLEAASHLEGDAKL